MSKENWTHRKNELKHFSLQRCQMKFKKSPRNGWTNTSSLSLVLLVLPTKMLTRNFIDVKIKNKNLKLWDYYFLESDPNSKFSAAKQFNEWLVRIRKFWFLLIQKFLLILSVGYFVKNHSISNPLHYMGIDHKKIVIALLKTSRLVIFLWFP